MALFLFTGDPTVDFIAIFVCRNFQQNGCKPTAIMFKNCEKTMFA